MWWRGRALFLRAKGWWGVSNGILHPSPTQLNFPLLRWSPRATHGQPSPTQRKIVPPFSLRGDPAFGAPPLTMQRVSISGVGQPRDH